MRISIHSVLVFTLTLAPVLGAVAQPCGDGCESPSTQQSDLADDGFGWLAGEYRRGAMRAPKLGLEGPMRGSIVESGDRLLVELDFSPELAALFPEPLSFDIPLTGTEFPYTVEVAGTAMGDLEVTFDTGREISIVARNIPEERNLPVETLEITTIYSRSQVDGAVYFVGAGGVRVATATFFIGR